MNNINKRYHNKLYWYLFFVGILHSEWVYSQSLFNNKTTKAADNVFVLKRTLNYV